MTATGMEASRQIFWNIRDNGFLDSGTAVVAISLVAGFLARLLSWQRGVPAAPEPDRPARIRATLRALLSNRGMLRGRYYLIAHRCIYYGFAILFLGTLLVAAERHGGSNLLRGSRYLLFSVILDGAGVAVLVGIVMAAHKRYVVKPDRLQSGFADAFFLLLLTVVVVSGFVVEGLRVAATADPWGAWAPMGALCALILTSFLDGAQLLAWHSSAWYGHAVASLALVALAPWSKMLHMVTVPLHIFSAPVPEQRTTLPEALPSEGTPTLAESLRRQLVELDACVNCGRCRKPCTIARSGLPEAPVTLVTCVKKYLHIGSWHTPIVGTAISSNALWACSTCRACEERCPMSGEHAMRFVGLRRSEVSAGAIPPEHGSRFAAVAAELTASTNQTIYPATGRVYIWPGCQRGDSPAAPLLPGLVNLLSRGGVRPVMLQPPTCCGGSLRRLGNETLFRKAAQATIDYLKPLGSAPIITICPHCANTMNNEYAQFGATVRVRHHAQALADLVAEGRMRSVRQLTGSVAFHDPCYLGRYQGEYRAPRAILAAVSLTAPKELKLSRQKSLCCGSGGGTVPTAVARENGRLWLQQAAKEKIDTVVTACPHCRENLGGVLTEVNSGHLPRVMDLVELIEEGKA